MSAQRSRPPLQSLLPHVVYSSAAAENREQCDGCRRMFALRQVELIGKQILCADCAPSEFTAPMHPHLPPHPRLRSTRASARL